MASRRLRDTTSICDIVSLGSPPDNLKAGAGKIFRVFPQPKDVKELKKYGVKNGHSTIVGTGETEVIRLRTDLEKLQRKVDNLEQTFAARALEFNLKTYKMVLMRRLVQEWAKSKCGKQQRQHLTECLKRKYLELGLSFVSQSVDFLGEYKFVILQLSKIEDVGEEQRLEEQRFEERLGTLQDVLAVECSGSLTPQGFEDVLRAYLNANGSVHERFTPDDLAGLLREVENGDLVVGEGGPWITKFSKDLMVT